MINDLYLITGNDEYLKQDALNKIKSKFNKLEKGVNYLFFDKDNLNSLGTELSTYSFFNEPKLVVVKVPKATRKTDEENEIELKPSKDWFNDDIEEKILNKIDSITLVFVEEASSKGRLFKLISNNGKVFLCDKKKPNELVGFVQNYCGKYETQIDRATASYFIEVCNSDTSLIVSELEKLTCYVENKKITREDIDLMCNITPEVIIFTLTDNLGSKRKKNAIQNLEDMLSDKEPLQKILIMIIRHFKMLIMSKECLNQKKDLAKELGLKPFSASKYSAQAKNFSMEELIKIFKQLVKLDVDSKTTFIDTKIGLQKIILDYFY